MGNIHKLFSSVADMMAIGILGAACTVAIADEMSLKGYVTTIVVAPNEEGIYFYLNDQPTVKG
jgi:hypothetical protein